jgi:hypothetical protein
VVFFVDIGHLLPSSHAVESAMLEYQSRMIDSRALSQLPDHSGKQRPAEVEFVAEPPAEIGKVKSAESSLRPGRQPMQFGVRLLIGAAVGGAVFYGALWAGSGANPFDRTTFQILGVLFGLGALGLTLLVTRFKAKCSYVGEQGAAYFILKGWRDAKPKVQMLLFANAQELRARQTRQYVNGVYCGTSYDYTWTDPAGKRLWRLKGTYYQRKKGLKAGEQFRFVQAAEIAWSLHYLERANQVLSAEGSIPFRVDKHRVVRVGPGFLEFHFGGEPVRLAREDIASVNLGSGIFQFKHKDAKWYSLSGKYTFQYGTMANGRVFLLALEKLMGYQWR